MLTRLLFPAYSNIEPEFLFLRGRGGFASPGSFSAAIQNG